MENDEGLSLLSGSTDQFAARGHQARVPSQTIKNGQIWMDLLDDRNVMAHVYQEKAARDTTLNIRELYVPEIEQIYNDLLKKTIMFGLTDIIPLTYSMLLIISVFHICIYANI